MCVKVECMHCRTKLTSEERKTHRCQGQSVFFCREVRPHISGQDEEGTREVPAESNVVSLFSLTPDMLLSGDLVDLDGLDDPYYGPY